MILITANHVLKSYKIVGVHKTPSTTVDIPIESLRPFKVTSNRDPNNSKFSWDVKVANMGSRPYSILAHIKDNYGYSINVREQPGNEIVTVGNGVQVVIAPTCMTTLVVTYTPKKKANGNLVEMVVVFESDRNVDGTKHYQAYFLGNSSDLSLMKEKYVLTKCKPKK